ncbi:MAG TPA: phosphosulfolactate phosphohydrolase, partial [Microbacterium sp.]|nr:phosphosulfolactate phosphohydrolase [Microbacterium sp.]
MPESPFDQHRYQVRHDWGIEGLRRLAPADVVVVVDVLRFSTTVTDAVARGETVGLDADAHAVSINGAAVAEAAAASGAVVLLGCLRNAAAV